MYKFLLLFLLLFNLEANESFFQQKDKQKHILTTTVVATLTTGLLKNNGYSDFESAIGGFSAAMLLGIAKEIKDKHDYGDFNTQDLAADMIGSTVGSLVSVQFKWKF